MSLEAELHETMLGLFTKTGRATGGKYWPRYFLRDVRKKGGLATAKQLLQSNTGNAKGAESFGRLIDAGCVELSIEATCLQPRFQSLFNEAELDEARKRLASIPSFAFKHSVKVEMNFAGELESVDGFQEGAVKQVLVNSFERDSKARTICAFKAKYRCAGCNVSFLERYGEIGRDFIHVHHRFPLAARREKYVVDPLKDLIAVCPNCHAMLHTSNPPLTIEELRERLISSPAMLTSKIN